MTDCPVDPCNRPTVPGWTICRHHSWTLEQALAETPALLRELDLTLARQRGNVAGQGSRSADKPLPYDLNASRALWLLRNTLTSWARELQLVVLSIDTTEAIAHFVLAHHHQLIVHAQADQAVDEITTATTEGWRIVQPNTRGRIPLPDLCPEPNCSQPMWATMHDVGDPRPNLVWCEATPERHEWRPEQWLRLGHRLGYGRTA